LRLIYTLAAPLFVILSGYLAFANKVIKDYPPRYYITRGIILIIVACFIDLLCYKQYPLFSFDVLYLIGFSTLIFPLLYMIHNKFKYSIFLIFLVTFLLQRFWGYDMEVIEYEIYHQLDFWNSLLVIFKQSLISGYFPIFPWLGIFMLGFLFYEEKYKNFFAKNGYFSIFLFLLLSFGLLSSDKYIRAGYSELFYPPDYVFILWTINLAILSFYLLYNKLYSKMGLIGKYFEIIGKSSLFFYVFHLFFIEYFLEDIKWSKVFFKYYSAYFELYFAYFITLVIIGLLALVFENIKKMDIKLPFVVRMFIGT
ncbi:MAG: heparan-alpha-glucosaminide N-acetyltransferase domain-containing protein, partial [bacterium]